MSVGISADRSNAILALSETDLMKWNPLGPTVDPTGWVQLADAVLPGQTMAIGMDGENHIADSGTFRFQLDNSEVNSDDNLGGYSPDSSDPIVPELKKGSPVFWLLDNSVWFRGVVDDIRVVPGKYEERLVEVVCVDGMEVLHTTNVSGLPVLSDVTTDEALRLLMDRIPYGPGTEYLNANPDDYTHEIANDRAYDEKTKAISLINQYLTASRGFFVASHLLGGFEYTSLDQWKKLHLITNSGGPAILDDTKILKMPEPVQSEVFNHIRVRYYPRRALHDATAGAHQAG
jgi:hypothetical protein